MSVESLKASAFRALVQGEDERVFTSDEKAQTFSHLVQTGNLGEDAQTSFEVNFQQAATNERVLRVLMQHPDFHHMSFNEAFSIVREHDHGIAARELMEDPRFSEVKQRALAMALCEESVKNHVNIVEALVESPRLSALNGLELGAILIRASKFGNSKVIQALMAHRNFSHISMSDLQRALSLAARNKHEFVIRQLMESPNFSQINLRTAETLIQFVSQHGHLDMVLALKTRLSEGRINTLSLEYAMQNNHWDIARELIRYARFPKVFPGTLNRMLKMTLLSGPEDMARAIITSPSFSEVSKASIKDHLKIAQEKGRTEIIELLEGELRRKGTFKSVMKRVFSGG